MYEKYWNLKEKPFETTPDPKFLYLSSQHEEGLSRLIYIVKESKGAGVLTGVFGCGKTLLARALLQHLEKDIYKVSFLTNPRVEDVDLLRMIVFHLGVSNVPEKKADVLMTLERIINDNYRDGKRTIVIIDEAHVVDDPNVFEEIRLLLNYQSTDKYLLTLLLLGQPELAEKVENNKQLSQRIAMSFHLIGLKEEEAKEYITHRLKVSGALDSVFRDSAMRLVYERSGGIPRRINQICDMSLVIGLEQEVKNIDEEIIKEAIDSLRGNV